MDDLQEFREFRAASALSDERVAVELTYGELDSLWTALLAAEDAVESVRAGEPTPYLRERYGGEGEDVSPGGYDPARNLNDDEVARWRELRRAVEREMYGHPSRLAMVRHRRRWRR